MENRPCKCYLYIIYYIKHLLYCIYIYIYQLCSLKCAILITLNDIKIQRLDELTVDVNKMT